MKQPLAIFGLLLASLLWGLTFILVKWAIAEIGVYYFLFLRFSIAFAILAIPFRRSLYRARWGTIRDSSILGIFLIACYILQTEGLRFTTASNSALITGLYAVFVPIFMAIFFKTRTNSLSAAGAVVSVAGLYLLTQYSFTGMNIGDFLTLLCAVAAAWYIILVGKYTVQHDILPLVMFQFLIMVLFCGSQTLIRGSYTSHIPAIAWIAILVTSTFCTVVVFLIQTWAQRIVDPTRAGIIFVMEAVFGVMFAYLLGGERLNTVSFIGACLMVSGMITSESYPIIQHMKTKFSFTTAP